MEKFNHLPLEIKKKLDSNEASLFCPEATISDTGIRRKKDKLIENDYRQAFGIDTDRILNSLSYTRYIDKTQVFSLVNNDHITHRVLHVQLVSKVARTIGRFLKLNEDLIEAIALGHDIGHTPFGHDGEKMLSELCVASSGEYFHHNAQSVHFLEHVERKGKGLNLCLQTLDGILCHNGEIHDQTISPDTRKTFAQLDAEIKQLKQGLSPKLVPMTLEGCVVRMADTISYIGRDIEDAIRLGIIKRKDIPEDCKKILGKTNGTIVYNLVTDLITSSYSNNCIGLSDKVSRAFKQLRHFNYEQIYMNTKMKTYNSAIKNLFKQMFEKYLNDIQEENMTSEIFVNFLSDMSDDYRNNHQNEEIVRDFISGMTDQYFLRMCPKEAVPDFKI